MSNKAIFLDRDGTIAPDVHYCHRPEDFNLFPDTSIFIKTMKSNGFKVILITNQSGIARGYFDSMTLDSIHNKLTQELAEDGTAIDAIYYCPHRPEDNCSCRKPKPGLLIKAARELEVNLMSSWMIGDGLIDIQAGENAGCRTILLNRKQPDSSLLIDTISKPFQVVTNLTEAAQVVLAT